MSIRRMMLFTLGGIFKSVIALFKTRVLSDGGNFEAETNLDNQLNTLGSTLFDAASLVITPNGVKTSKLYSIKPNDGTGDLSVVRNTSATRIDENGNIVNVSANVARIDYSNGSPAILVEPQRTNLVYPSDIATTQVRAVTAQVYTLSFYGTGSVALSGAFSGSLVGTGTNKRVSLTFTPTAGNLTLTISGTVTNWQLEAGSNATSLIRTVSGSVTRNADIISKSGIIDLIGQTDGSIFIDANFTNTIGSSQTFISLNDGTINNRIVIYKASTSLGLVVYNNNVLQAIINTANPINNRFKAVAVYSNNNVKFFVNGSLTNTDTSATIPSTYYIDLGSQLSNSFSIINDRINYVFISKTLISDQQAIQLTTL